MEQSTILGVVSDDASINKTQKIRKLQNIYLIKIVIKHKNDICMTFHKRSIF